MTFELCNERKAFKEGGQGDAQWSSRRCPASYNAAEPQLKKLVRRRTGELALLITALVESSQAVTNALSQAEKMEHAPPLAGTGSAPLPSA